MSTIRPQLEKQDDGSLYVCAGGRREVYLPAGAAAYLETILARFDERDLRGVRLFLTGVIVGVLLATGHFPARKRSPHPENPHTDFQTSPQGGGES